MKNLLTAIFFLTCSYTFAQEQSDKQFFNRLQYGDTLEISAMYSECGEFGGNESELRLFYHNDQLQINQRRFLMDCENGNVSKCFDSIFVSTDEVNEGVMQYLLNLTEMSFYIYPSSHLGNLYTAEIAPSHEIYQDTLNDYCQYRVIFYDTELKWEGFKKLLSDLQLQTEPCKN